jgi:lysophospholipase L1-like esterase
MLDTQPKTSSRPLARLAPFFAALVIACSASEDDGMQHGGGAVAPVSIAVLGSSTAAGFGLADPATSWVMRYAAHLDATRPGSQLTNLAVSGYSTFNVLPTGTENPSGRPIVDTEHNVSKAIEHSPQAIIVNLPSNDAAFGFSLEETMQNLHTVATAANESGIAVWVCTSQPRQLDSSGILLLEALRDRTLADFAPRAIDFWTPLAAADGAPLSEYNAGDGIHPNAEGHRVLFEQVVLAGVPASLE